MSQACNQSEQTLKKVSSGSFTDISIAHLEVKDNGRL